MAHIILLSGSVSRMTFIVQKSEPRHREVNDMPSVTQLVRGKVGIGIQNVWLQARAPSHCHGPSAPSCIRGVCGRRLCEDQRPLLPPPPWRDLLHQDRLHCTEKAGS